MFYVKWSFFFHCLGKSLKGRLLRLGCNFFSTWHYLKHNSIWTTGQVLKIGNIYTYHEGWYVDIVRLTDVHIERGYLFCSLFFFSKNKIITVRQTLQKDAYIIWRLMDIGDYDEIMSRRLWHDVNKKYDVYISHFKSLFLLYSRSISSKGW
jgi:hypothetical protein